MENIHVFKAHFTRWVMLGDGAKHDKQHFHSLNRREKQEKPQIAWIFAIAPMKMLLKISELWILTTWAKCRLLETKRLQK